MKLFVMMASVPLINSDSCKDDSSTSCNTDLPIVNQLVNHFLPDLSALRAVLQNATVICVSHLLKTSIAVWDALYFLGLPRNQLYVMGKFYSDSPAVIRKLKKKGINVIPSIVPDSVGSYSNFFNEGAKLLWRKALLNMPAHIESIIILDHGGSLIKNAPFKQVQKFRLVAVEKTTQGIFQLQHQSVCPLPLINVAQCAAKKHLESAYIVKTVLRKVYSILPSFNQLSDKRVGIVGLGTIGMALLSEFSLQGASVSVYDKNRPCKVPPNTKICDSITSLVNEVDVIFGCTGHDITANWNPLEKMTSDTVWISCSSGDIEFKSLLQQIQQKKFLEKMHGKSYLSKNHSQNVLEDVFYFSSKNTCFRIIRGGFPVNFDNSGESVPAKDIQLTRALVVGAIIQAAKFIKNRTTAKKIFVLDPVIQKIIVLQWLKYKLPNIIESKSYRKFQNIDWIAHESASNPIQR